MSDKKIYCGFGIHYDPDTNERFEKTASGDFSPLHDNTRDLLERDFIDKGMEKAAAELTPMKKGGKLN